LQSGDPPTENRVRREGGGRKKVRGTQPTLVGALDAMVEPTAKGDPMSPLRWTTKSTRRLAEVLVAQGFTVSHTQVHKLLREQGFRLAANRKSIEGGTNPDRDAQFEFM